MWHLANAGDFPAIFVVQGVANLALHHASRVCAADRFEAIRAAMFLHDCDRDFGFAVQHAASLWAYR